MSRVGKMPVTVPQGVDVSINNTQINVKGSGGSLSIAAHALVKVVNEAGQVTFTPVDDSREANAMSGTLRQLVNNMVTGVIKANIPSRIALQVTNGIDSRVILDDLGAENLLGKGDLLYLSPGASKASRGQGAFVSEEEVHRVIDFIAAQVPADRNSDLHKKLNSEEEQEALDEESLERLKHCYQIMRAKKKSMASFSQRRMSIGYNTAARLIEVLEKRGVIGEADSNNPARAREILIDLENPPKWLL